MYLCMMLSAWSLLSKTVFSQSSLGHIWLPSILTISKSFLLCLYCTSLSLALPFCSHYYCMAFSFVSISLCNLHSLCSYLFFLSSVKVNWFDIFHKIFFDMSFKFFTKKKKKKEKSTKLSTPSFQTDTVRVSYFSKPGLCVFLVSWMYIFDE